VRVGEKAKRKTKRKTGGGVKKVFRYQATCIRGQIRVGIVAGVLLQQKGKEEGGEKEQEKKKIKKKRGFQDTGGKGTVETGKAKM